MQDFTRDELLSLLRVARANSERDWLMILMAYSHGLRASEVISIQVNNIDSGHLTVQRLKGSLKTSQALLDSSDPLLDERAAVFAFTRRMHEKQRLFPVTRQRFWQIMRKHGTEAGLPKHKLHPHTLKHTTAMQMIASTGIENTRQYCGHKSIASTGAYLRVTDKRASEAARGALVPH